MSELSSAPVCQHLSPGEIASRCKEAVLVDVRSPLEFETEHIEGAVNIPLNEIDSRFNEIPRKGELFVICRSGKRAERGAYQLAGQGFEPKVLEGGMVAWRAAGLPVKEGKKMFPIERQIQLIVGIGVLSGVLLGAFYNPWFLVIPGFFGAGLTFAGASGTCALGILLGKAPWNKLPVDQSCGAGKSKSSCCG
jgi:rhodanese-related sulfurtransferase